MFKRLSLSNAPNISSHISDVCNTNLFLPGTGLNYVCYICRIIFRILLPFSPNVQLMLSTIYDLNKMVPVSCTVYLYISSSAAWIHLLRFALQCSKSANSKSLQNYCTILTGTYTCMVSQRYVVYLGWPIVPSYIYERYIREKETEWWGCGLSLAVYSCAHGAQLNSIKPCGWDLVVRASGCQC